MGNFKPSMKTNNKDLLGCRVIKKDKAVNAEAPAL